MTQRLHILLEGSKDVPFDLMHTASTLPRISSTQGSNSPRDVLSEPSTARQLPLPLTALVGHRVATLSRTRLI